MLACLFVCGLHFVPVTLSAMDDKDCMLVLGLLASPQLKTFVFAFSMVRAGTHLGDQEREREEREREKER